MNGTGRIADLVQVRPHPTVVRLADADASSAQWIEQSYLLTADVQGHLQALRHALGRGHGSGIFLIGHYGAGKSHFLAYLQRRLRAGDFRSPAPAVLPLSLLNYRAEMALEDIVGTALELEPGGGDRRETWAPLAELYPNGLLLMLDELSEFLRAKPSPQAFHEDIRFLQFLGEWAQDHKLWILAAMQEQIEHTGDLEYGLYRKIKDRYPLRLLLSPAHVKELLADCILEKSPGYAPAVERLASELHEAFPDVRVDFADLTLIYPLHPATLELLEEVRDRFSSARGVVDFTVAQLCGNPERGIEPFLERPWGSLLTPDYILDHFRDLLEVQPDFLPLAQKLFPHYRKQMGALFPQAARQDLAWRLLKLLVLVHLSPERELLTPQQAAAWLLFKVTRVDPARNLALVQKTLEQLAAEGRFVQRQGAGFRLNLQDDSAASLDRLLQRELRDLPGDPELVMEQIVPHLGGEGFNPFVLPRERWQNRSVRWHFHAREFAVCLSNGQPQAPSHPIALCLRLPWGEIPEPVPGVWTLQPAALAVTEDLRELAALLRLSERVLAPEVMQRLQRRVRERLGLMTGQLTQAYRELHLSGPDGRPEGGFPDPGSKSLDAWLETCVPWILRRRYPSFERFAPTHGPLPKEAYRQFMRAVQVLGLEQPRSPQAGEYLDVIREGYLVPMGLLRRAGNGYQLPAKLDGHELVQQVQRLVEHRPAPKTLYEHLAEPVYGLVPEQVNLLLLFLLVLGELDIVKAGQSYRDHWETLPLPIQYDRLEPARALGVDQLKELERLCEGLGLRIPAQWTVLAQRQMARRLAGLAAERGRELGTLARRLEEQQGGETLRERLQSHLAHWRSLEQGDALQALQQFLYQVGSSARFLSDDRELGALPARLDRFTAELSRLRHLFAQPPFTEGEWADRLTELGQSPGLDQGEELDDWLQAAGRLYQTYAEAYREAHDTWWRQANQDPLWQWQPPALARSRHLHLERELEDWQSLQRQAFGHRCRGQLRLDYQTRCSCGFDGETAPAARDLEGLASLRKQLESALERFFSQDQVRERVDDWLNNGQEVNTDTQAYLAGQAKLPQVRNLTLFDRHLAGVETVDRISANALLADLAGPVWEPQALAAELTKRLQGRKAERIRIELPAAEGATDPLFPWALQQCLRHSVPLPVGLTSDQVAQAAGLLRPEWVSPSALAELEELRLGEAAENRILGWLLDGSFPVSDEPGPSPLIRAALEILRPSSPAGPSELARLAAALYRRTPRLIALSPDAWMERLEALAHTPLPHSPEGLPDLLARDGEDVQWLVIDALGLPLLELLQTRVEHWLPHWRMEQTGFATVNTPTDTDGFFARLLEGGINHPLEKINALDRLLHERDLPFDDMERLADAEIQAAARAVTARMDPKRPLRVFADHGFRLNPQGRGYRHGGGSTLEKVVPVIGMTPRC